MSLGEAGLMATLYTRDMGKLKAMVRSARKPTSKMVGHLEPLNLVHLSLAASRPGGIDTVIQAQTLDSHSRLKADLEGISRAIYVAELADGFGAEGSRNTGLYDLLLETVGSLQGDPDPELTLRYFELHILKCSGFMPELYGCVDCRRPPEPGKHRFSPEMGGVLCLGCTPAGAPHHEPLPPSHEGAAFHRPRPLGGALPAAHRPRAPAGAEGRAERCAKILAGPGNPVQEIP
jgi:DNA repair protein RecO (recombination protein O)